MTVNELVVALAELVRQGGGNLPVGDRDSWPIETVKICRTPATRPAVKWVELASGPHD